MMKMRHSWMVCEYQPVCIGGYCTFMPILCASKRAKRAVSHGKKNR